MTAQARKYLKSVSVVLFLVAMDLWTKHLISADLALGQSRKVIENYFSLTLVHNKGAAFGIGNKWAMPFFVAISFVAIIVVINLYLRLKVEERLSRWGLTLILAGAIGNLTDRIRLGYVVDFLDVYVGRHHWPAFNVADSCITTGACLFALDMLLSGRKKSSEKSPG